MFKWILLFAFLLLTACGGSGDTPPPVIDPPLNSSLVSGTAFDSDLRGAKVNVYDYSNGTQGRLLGTNYTDGGGGFKVKVAAESGPILIVVFGGEYTEEAGQFTVFLNENARSLYAVANYQTGVPLHVSPTYLTTLAAGLAQYLVSTGMTATNAVIEANQRISQWVGFNIEVVDPVNVSQPQNAATFLSDELKYGFLSAAISDYTYKLNFDSNYTPHTFYTTNSFIGFAYFDIKADGALDGFGLDGRQLNFGKVVLNEDVYRSIVSASIRHFISNSDHKTTLTEADVEPFIYRLNDYTGDIFNNTTPLDLTTTTPTVTNFLPQEGATVSGDYPAFANISDLLGVASVDYYVDDFYVAGANVVVPVRDIVTTNFSNGVHKFSIHVTNIMGNVTIVDHNVTISN